MVDLALVPLVIASCMGVTIGVKYMRAEAFMPYHAAVTGKTWPDIDDGIKVVILGMLRIIGAGLVSLGVTNLWLCYALHEGARWSAAAILLINAIALGPTLFVNLKLRQVQPAARPPVVPTVAAIALIVIGTGLALL